MATAVALVGPHARPTISSSARSSIAARQQQQSSAPSASAASRLAAGSQRRTSAAPPSSSSSALISATTQRLVSSASLRQPQQKSDTATTTQRPSVSSLKIPSLSTALVQSGPASAKQQVNRPVSSVVGYSGGKTSPTPSTRPASMLVTNQAVQQQQQASSSSSPPAAMMATPTTTTSSSSSAVPPSAHHPATTTTTTTTSNAPSGSQQRLLKAGGSTTAASTNHNTTSGAASFVSSSSRMAATVSMAPVAASNGSVRPTAYHHHQTRLASKNVNSAASSAATNTTSTDPSNNKLSHQEPPAVKQPVIKETTLGAEIETTLIEQVVVTAPQPQPQPQPVVVVAPPVVSIQTEERSTNTTTVDYLDGGAQTNFTGTKLDLAYSQMLSRFLAMSVVAQDLSARLTHTLGRSKRIEDERAKTESKLRKDFDEAISKLITQHATELALVSHQHQEENKKSEDSFRAKLVEAEERLAAEHVQQLRDLETDWSSRMAALKEDFLGKLEAQKVEAEKREQHLSTLICSEDEAVARRVEAETTRFKACFAENDSLRAVLDLRGSELRQLRGENAQHRVNLEEMPVLRERIVQLEHQIENLEAILSVRRDQERVLNERQRELMARIDEEEAEKRQLWRACEVLVYQLQSAGTLPVSTPFMTKSPPTASSTGSTSPPSVNSLPAHHQLMMTPASPSSPPPPSVNTVLTVTPPFSTPLIPAGCTSRFLITANEFPTSNCSSPDVCCQNHQEPLVMATTSDGRACSPGTDLILQKIIQSSQRHHHHDDGKMEPGGAHTDNKQPQLGDSVYSSCSDASPRSMSSGPSSSASPPPSDPRTHHHHQLINGDDSLNLSSTSSTSGCYSSNELDELKSTSY